ncbi:S1 RNA-binding domain-containing protein [bacterium]|nr:S1 RNA-binding domain-containing protein [bacterium]
MAREEVSRLLEEKIASFKPGSLIKGKILRVLNDDVIIDIEYKSEGVAPREEFKNDSGEELEGTEVTVIVESLDPDKTGLIPLSKEKADILLHWENIEKAYEADTPIEGTIFKSIKGGFRVDIGVLAFLPTSQADIAPLSNPAKLINSQATFKIIKLDALRKNVVVSRRKFIEEEQAVQKKEYLSELQKNQLVTGVVRNIVDYGAFIEIEYGLVGLLHLNDMSWGKVSYPSQLLSLGQKVEVVILDVDLEKQIASFGLKQKTPNPWENIEEKYPIGSTIEGKIVNITDYGAFVKIEEGVEGLLHISELSWTGRVRRPSEIVAMGDPVTVKVIDIKKAEQKISFSLRELESNPWPEIAEKFPVGSIVKGKVYNITDFGAFVEIEKDIDGLLHISNISTEQIKHPSDVLHKGQKLEVMILEIDPDNKRISLGLKQLGDIPIPEDDDEETENVETEPDTETEDSNESDN